MMISEVGQGGDWTRARPPFDFLVRIAEIREGGGVVRPLADTVELRNRDSRQESDDDRDDHELDQRETTAPQ